MIKPTAYYGRGRVDVSDIVLDVAMHQAGRAVGAARTSSINNEGTKYSVRPLCESFDEASRPIDPTPLEVNEFTSIMEDVVEGVRAHLISQKGKEHQS